MEWVQALLQMLLHDSAVELQIQTEDVCSLSMYITVQ